MTHAPILPVCPHCGGGGQHLMEVNLETSPEIFYPPVLPTSDVYGFVCQCGTGFSLILPRMKSHPIFHSDYANATLAWPAHS